MAGPITMKVGMELADTFCPSSLKGVAAITDIQAGETVASISACKS